MSFHNLGLSVHRVSDSFPVLLPVWPLFRKTEVGVLLPYPVHHLSQLSVSGSYVHKPYILFDVIFQLDISFIGFQFFISGLCSFQPAHKCDVIISVRHTFPSRTVIIKRR